MVIAILVIAAPLDATGSKIADYGIFIHIEHLLNYVQCMGYHYMGSYFQTCTFHNLNKLLADWCWVELKSSAVHK